MKIEDAVKPPEGLSSRRFFRVSYLPTAASLIFLLVLSWAGAPGKEVTFADAWSTAKNLEPVEVVLIAIGISLAAVVLQPLQHSILRALEGYWPRWLGSDAGRSLQLWHKRRLERAISKIVDQAVALPDRYEFQGKRDGLVQRAGAATAKLRSRYPLNNHLVRPTALGNVMTAAEDTAGSAYGLDAVVVWPRLYHVMGDRARAHVDDLRDTVDASARLAAMGTFTAVATAVLLLWHLDWWMLLALIPLGVAVLGYAGSVRAAVAYGLALQVAFDLYRFDLLEAMRFAVPAKREAELKSNRELSDFLRQGVPMTAGYVPSKNKAATS